MQWIGVPHMAAPGTKSQSVLFLSVTPALCTHNQIAMARTPAVRTTQIRATTAATRAGTHIANVGEVSCLRWWAATCGMFPHWVSYFYSFLHRPNIFLAITLAVSIISTGYGIRSHHVIIGCLYSLIGQLPWLVMKNLQVDGLAIKGCYDITSTLSKTRRMRCLSWTQNNSWLTIS
ncbi:hypothetical protein F4860DRAFT_370560 [Xylaria cubensis]|nr:hypothetical protein F4860DRAFT_370560 [Xylaria cubensis]